MGVSQTYAQKKECKEIRKHISPEKRGAKKGAKVFHFGTEHGMEQLKTIPYFGVCSPQISAKESLKGILRGSIHNVYSEFDLGSQFVTFNL